MSGIASAADAAVARFLKRVERLPGLGSLAGGVQLLDNPTEELVEAIEHNKSVKLFARGMRAAMPMAGAGRPVTKAVARLEENYLYSSRRFPMAANNTIGAGALGAGTFPFFSKAVGDDGSGMGFPTGSTLTTQETNVEVGGQIAQGTSFVFNQIGITLNADASTPDVNQLLEAAVLTFTKAGGQFSLVHGPVKMWPGGMGTHGYAATAVGGAPLTIQGAHNGVADIRAVRNLRIARVLKEKETFNYNLVIARTTKATDGTAWALSNFVIATIWLWGGQKNVIPT